MQCGIAPSYVLDEMETYEMSALIENLWMKNKDSWEQARMISYITAQCNSTKQMSPDDILKLPWENRIEHHETQEEIQDVISEMRRLESKMNNKQ